VSDTVLAYTTARSISSLSDADVVPLALAEWVAGRSYAAIHDLLSRRRVRVSRNNATIADVVALCENGFGYDVAMVVASLADLAEPLDPALRGALALLQRQVKNGLTETAALAFLEAGLLTELWRRRWVRRGREFVSGTVRAPSAGTNARLFRLSSTAYYFRAVAAELSA
jgi:hypothetical protein